MKASFETPDYSQSWQDPSIDESIQKELEESGVYFEELDPGIELSEDTKEFLSDLRYFCASYIKEFQETFWEKADAYELSPKQKINEGIKSFLRDNKLDSPILVIRNGKTSKDFLNKNSFEHSIKDQHFLLELQLPKQLSFFWWKDKKQNTEESDEPNSKRTPIGNAGVAWGDIYRTVAHIIWDKMENQFGAGQIDFERINPPRVHDPRGFYYLFDVSKLRKSD